MLFGPSPSPPGSSPLRSAPAELIRELGLVAASLSSVFVIGRWVEAGKVDGLHGLIALGLIAAPSATIGAVALLMRARQPPGRRRTTTTTRWDDKTPAPTPPPLILPPGTGPRD